MPRLTVPLFVCAITLSACKARDASPSTSAIGAPNTERASSYMIESAATETLPNLRIRLGVQPALEEELAVDEVARRCNPLFLVLRSCLEGQAAMQPGSGIRVVYSDETPMGSIDAPEGMSLVDEMVASCVEDVLLLEPSMQPLDRATVVTIEIVAP